MENKKVIDKEDSIELIGIGEEDFAMIDESDEQPVDMFAMICKMDHEGKMWISSWRAWLHFLMGELRSELYEKVPHEYLKHFDEIFFDIKKFINIAATGEDRILLDEKISITTKH